MSIHPACALPHRATYTLANMPLLVSPLTPKMAELDGLRSAMRDIQVSVSDLYRCSTGFGVDADTLATPVRASVSFVQVLNDVLRNDFSEKAVYRKMFDTPQDPRIELIQAFQYVRNVGQHLLHPVKPDSSAVVGGIGLGYRTYAIWDEIPRQVHARLHPKTQPLKVLYDAHLKERDVVETLLDAARFFWEVCPDLIHRRSNGEWTGFPLRHQPGVRSRLHPEEPSDEGAALQWMSARKPGGHIRVLCGSLDEPTGEVLFGLTFTGRCAFVPFFETLEQVRADIALGFTYHEGDVGSNTYVNDQICDVGGRFPPTLCSASPIDSWISEPLDAPRQAGEHSSYESTEFWREQLMLEHHANAQWFLTRRERRLNAWFPLE